jgi:hypothetical protein
VCVCVCVSVRPGRVIIMLMQRVSSAAFLLPHHAHKCHYEHNNDKYDKKNNFIPIEMWYLMWVINFMAFSSHIFHTYYFKCKCNR